MIAWPTHRVKARKTQNTKLHQKKRGRRLRKIQEGGKRV